MRENTISFLIKYYFLVCVGFKDFGESRDTLAERLRREPRKLMGFPRAGSNPAGVG